MDIWWIILGVPLVASVAGRVMLCSRRRLESHHLRAFTAMTMATAPVALAIGAFAYVSFVRPVPSSNYDVERTGLLLSAIAIATAVSSRWCTQHWISILTGTISLYMFVHFFLAASTI
jgi:hypothetical protein